MQFLKSSVGRKILMALTGLLMVLFVVAHMVGNSLLYFGYDTFNAYAAGLQRLIPLLWSFRLLLLTVFLAHVVLGIQITLENRAAQPVAYAVKQTVCSTFESRNMIWTGLLVGGFIVFHLLHFTMHVIYPNLSSAVFKDAAGRPDVYRMVLLNFARPNITFVYVLAMAALFLHLSHGVQSLFQTLGQTGWKNSEKTFALVKKGGYLAALAIFAGFVLLPVVIYLGVVR